MNPGSATQGPGDTRLQRFAAHIVGAASTTTAPGVLLFPAAAGAAGGAHPTVDLSNGLAIPAVGFGCALFSLQPDNFSIGGPQGQGDLAPLREKVEQILDAGYVHLDTAHCYHTEIPIGQVLAKRIADGSLRREDVWITTKTSDPILPENSYMFDPAADSYQGVLDEFVGCLKRLQVDHVDLLLLHWPGPKPEPQTALGVDRPAGRLTPAQADKKRADMWRALEHLYKLGLARSIGVSNWTQRHLERLLAPGGCTVVPHMNQLPIFTALQQHTLVDYCAANGIATTAYSPLSGSDLTHPTLTALATKLGSTPAGVVLRWLQQRGIVTIPKSVTPSRMVSNLTAAQDCPPLSASNMAALRTMEDAARENPGDSIV